jgi:hypothetical protein
VGKEIGHVGAGNEQNETDRAEQEEGSLASMADEMLVGSLDPGGSSEILGSDPASLDHLQFRASLGQSRSGAQASDLKTHEGVSAKSTVGKVSRYCDAGLAPARKRFVVIRRTRIYS